MHEHVDDDRSETNHQIWLWTMEIGPWLARNDASHGNEILHVVQKLSPDSVEIVFFYVVRMFSKTFVV